MNDTAPAAGRSWIRPLLGYSALVLIPSVLALVVLGAKFRGLAHPVALEHAQIARHVAAGEGLATDSIRPLSLAIRPKVQGHPDLYHAPAHPLLLGLAYAIVRPSDRLTAAIGLLLWIVSVFLTFFLARRWFGTPVACVAAALYGGNAAMIKAALLGLPHPLCAILVLLAAAVAAPRPREEPAQTPPAEGISGAWIAAAGMLCALAAMTHYLLFFLAPAVAAPLIVSRRRRGRALLMFAAGFLAVIAPWMIRNFRLGGSPFFSLYWYEALAGTDAWPGDSVWRSGAAAATGPLEFLFTHPIQSARKAMGGLIRFWNESVQVLDPAVAFLFAACLLSGRLAAERRAWLGWMTAGAVFCAAASCALRAEPEILLAWTPLLAIGAAAFLTSWLSERAEQISLREAWKSGLLRTLFRHPDRARLGGRIAATAAVCAIAGFPLFHYVWIFRPEPTAARQDAALLMKHIPEQATVMTDQPAFVAWYGRRRSLWLCLEEKEWDAIEGRGGRIDATYITPAAGALLPREGAGWWWWIASPRGVYRNLAPVDTALPRGVLRVRGKERG